MPVLRILRQEEGRSEARGHTNCCYRVDMATLLGSATRQPKYGRFIPLYSPSCAYVCASTVGHCCVWLGSSRRTKERTSHVGEQQQHHKRVHGWWLVVGQRRSKDNGGGWPCL